MRTSGYLPLLFFLFSWCLYSAIARPIHREYSILPHPERLQGELVFPFHVLSVDSKAATRYGHPPPGIIKDDVNNLTKRENIFKKIGRKIKSAFTKAGKAIKKAFTKAGRAIKKGFTKAGRAIKKGFTKAGKAIGHAVKTGFKKVKKFVQSTGKKIAKFGLEVGSAITGIISTVSKVIPIPGIGQSIGAAFKAASMGLSKASDAIHATLSKGLQRGIAVLKKVADPIGAAAHAIAHKIKHKVTGAK
ncbi:hypothetical protein CVT24_011346 [Panaeolus cyanescens]|uniref:Uncharacterized protein n=1 Tax=Panaeolus cyanescens TaxID=181874 RepID=A0A409YGM9_9AGAR|nr:hypothetical protein CVT24_011346 [Panaeolus cyanescens]